MTRAGHYDRRRRLLGCDVEAIRRLHAAGVAGYARLAWLYGCSAGAVEAVVKRRTWKHEARP